MATGAPRGPVPKRSDQRRRRNKDSQVEKVDLSGTSQPVKVEAPELGFTTHPIAEQWYASLADSGQSRFYEPSDWQSARMLTHEMGRMLNAGRVSAQTLAAVWSAMGDMLSTEASRRRVRMEIERGEGGGDPKKIAAVARMSDYLKMAE